MTRIAPPNEVSDGGKTAIEDLRIHEALTRHRQGLPLTSTQKLIVAHHPQGTAAGCASCGR